MRAPSAASPACFVWRSRCFASSRPCVSRCSITATRSDRLADTGSGMFRGDAAEQGIYCGDGLLRFRPMRVVLDHQLTGEDLAGVDLDTGADGEVELAVAGGQFHIGRRTH